MKVLVFEFLSGGGVADRHPLDESQNEFLRQGKSMLIPFCEDLLKQGHQVVVPIDPETKTELPPEVETCVVTTPDKVQQVLCELAEIVDSIVIVAPESDGCLEAILEYLQPWEKKLFSPNLEFVRLTADKWKFHRFLRTRGIPCPRTWKMEAIEQVALLKWRPNQQYVVKPIDGAGSEGVRVVTHRDELLFEQTPYLLQQYVPGEPVSVLCLSDGTQVSILEPGRQVFDAQPIGTHVRTEFPLDDQARRRTIEMAQKVVSVLPKTQGYFGMDLVIGETHEEDVLIEVNPRLTTSYGFLRDWNHNKAHDGMKVFEHRPKGFKPSAEVAE